MTCRPLNPLQLLTDAHTNPVDAVPEPMQDDAEVFLGDARTRRPIRFPHGFALLLDEVQAQIAEHIKSTMIAGDCPLFSAAAIALDADEPAPTPPRPAPWPMPI